MAIKKFYNEEQGLKGSGSGVIVHVLTIETTADNLLGVGDVALSTPMSGELIPVSMEVISPALTGVTAAKLGFFHGDVKDNAAINDDALDAALDISASGYTKGLTSVAVGDADKTIRELCGANAKIGNPTEFVLGLTVNAAIGAGKKIIIRLICAQQ